MVDIIGIAENVSESTKGVKINEQWYSATPVSAKYVKKEYEGKQIKIKLTPEGKSFQFITLIDQQASPAKGNTQAPVPNYMAKDNYWEGKEKREEVKNIKVSRHGALNTAIQCIKVATAGNSTDKLTADMVLEGAEHLAERILQFINKGGS